MVRVARAEAEDVPQIAGLIGLFAAEGLLLPRSPQAIAAGLRHFFVARRGGRVVGVCALQPMGPDLAEIRSLAVAPDAQGQGVGTRLVEACLEEAARLRVRRVFALTYQVAFFERLGFTVVDKHHFPEKVWRDCRFCPKLHCCDEVAMLREVSTEAAAVL